MLIAAFLSLQKFKEIQQSYDILMGRSKIPPPKPSRQKHKPRKRDDVDPNLGVYSHAQPPLYDIWGKKLTAEERQEWLRNNVNPNLVVKRIKKTYDGWIDSFANQYEDGSQPSIR